jgi:alkylation response protein AidB-like acyl-CoA dehydrogenase
MQAETRYHPNADQLEVVSAIDESLADVLPVSRLHTSFVEDAKTWSSLEDIGIFGISLSEDQGGSGLGAAEEALITVGLGRRLASPAILATLGASQVSAGRRVAAGFQRNARATVVADAATELLLLRDADTAALYEAGACTTQRIDNHNWLAELHAITQLGAPLLQFNALQVLRLRLLDAAALAGMAEATLTMAVAYAGIREQFGRPIGSFQAVKHHCANMAMAARCARDQVSFAAVALDENRDDAALQVECALFTAGTAALDNAGTNIQIHGGMGFSDEADPHLFLKRAQVQLAIAGGLEAANVRIANAKAG